MSIFRVQPGGSLTEYERKEHRDKRDKMECFLASCDEKGRAVFTRIFTFAREKAMPINWGDPGFSVNVGIGRDRVAFCYGNPPRSARGQSVFIPLRADNAVGKAAIPEERIQQLEDLALSIEIFEPAGRLSLKCPIERRLTDTEMDDLLTWFELVAEAIREYGLRAGDTVDSRTRE